MSSPTPNPRSIISGEVLARVGPSVCRSATWACAQDCSLHPCHWGLHLNPFSVVDWNLHRSRAEPQWLVVLESRVRTAHRTRRKKTQPAGFQTKADPCLTATARCGGIVGNAGCVSCEIWIVRQPHFDWGKIRGRISGSVSFHWALGMICHKVGRLSRLKQRNGTGEPPPLRITM